MKKKRMVQKICTMALALLMTAAVTATPGPMQRTYADDGVAIDAAHFPDENFRKYISKHCDKNDDDILSPAEISSITTLDPWSSSIQDFKGIEIFTNLTKFDCRWNPVISLDLSHNTALTSINCDGNELESLDVSKNTALTTLNCSSSTLTSLDLSQNTALTTLRCENSQLQSLDLTRNTALNTLYCGGNQITRLDLSHNPSLTFLDCRNNQLLTSLDLSNNTAISHLDCSNTSLTNLDLTNDTALVNLYCGDTQLTNLDLSRNTKLRHLNCSGSKLTSLDVSLNPALRELYCNNNTLTDLDLSSNTSLEALDCSGNKLTNLDLSENTNLFILDCSNNKLMSLDLSSNTFLHNSDDTYKTYFNSQSRSIGAAYSDGKLVVDLADDLGLDMSRVSDVVVTGGTYSDGKATFDIPVAADAMITYNYDTNNTNLSTKMDVTLRVTVCRISRVQEEKMGRRPHITEQTRENLIQSFWDLLEEKPLDRITVKEITDHAGYYRSTFYQYFDDIRDLSDQVGRALITDIKKQARASLTSSSTGEFIPISELFYSENSRYLKILLKQDANTSFLTDLKSELRLLVLSWCGCSEDDLESKYIIEYALSALLGTLSLWFRSGEDISIDRLTGIVNPITKKLMARVTSHHSH